MMATADAGQPPIPNRSTTSRGFAIYDEFRDLSGKEVRVQKSSLAMIDAVWIFLGEDGTGGAVHLDAAMARRVVAALTAWLDEIGEGDTCMQ